MTYHIEHSDPSIGEDKGVDRSGHRKHEGVGGSHGRRKTQVQRIQTQIMRLTNKNTGIILPMRCKITAM